MDIAGHPQFKHSSAVEDVSEKILEMFAPNAIYLYNQRVGSRGHTSGFKLCVILSTQEKDIVERDIYLNIDCEVPFDVLIYTPEEWDALQLNEGSFARKIKETGLILYE